MLIVCGSPINCIGSHFGILAFSGLLSHYLFICSSVVKCCFYLLSYSPSLCGLNYFSGVARGKETRYKCWISHVSPRNLISFTFCRILSWEMETKYLWMTVNLTMSHFVSFGQSGRGNKWGLILIHLKNAMGPTFYCGEPCSIFIVLESSLHFTHIWEI